jgi:hypothetical protein
MTSDETADFAVEFWLSHQPQTETATATNRVPLFEWSQSFHLIVNRNIFPPENKLLIFTMMPQ